MPYISFDPIIFDGGSVRVIVVATVAVHCDVLPPQLFSNIISKIIIFVKHIGRYPAKFKIY